MNKKPKLPLPFRIIRWSFPKVEALAPSVAAAWAWKLFFTPLRFKAPVAEEEIIENAYKFHLNVANKYVQCYEWGAGKKTIVVVHGWSGRAAQFRKFVGPLNEAGYRVVGFDGPGHGKSTGNRTHIMEFVTALQLLQEKYSNISAIIAHSFGGAASLMAIREGLRINQLINIGSPTDGDYIIADFLRRINGSPKSGERFKQRVQDQFHRSFSSVSIKESIKQVSNLELLIIHDKDDKEVPFQHAEEVHIANPYTRLLLTEGLGHMRILKDKKVIDSCLKFINTNELVEI